MIVKTKLILYIGSDDTFFEEVEDFFLKRERNGQVQTKVSKIDPLGDNWQNELFDNYEDGLPHLIFIDFYNIESRSHRLDDIIKLMVLLKKHHLARTIPLIGLFANKDNFAQMNYLFAYGLVYGYIKRESSDKVLFQDAAYFAFEKRAHNARYATANKLNLKYHIASTATIKMISTKGIVIENDIDLLPDQEVEVEQQLFPDFKLLKLDVFESVPNFSCFNFFNTSFLNFKYPTPWDEITEDTIYEDTVATWIDLNQAEFVDCKGDVLIVSSQQSHLKEIYHEINGSGIIIHYKSEILAPENEIKYLRPGVIIFCLDDEEEDPDELVVGEFETCNNSEMLFTIVKLVKEYEDYIPLLVAFNSKSSSEALQKAFDYPAILASSHDLEMKLVRKMLQIYSAKLEGVERETVNYCLKKTNERKQLYIRKQIVISSLNEHEITFLTEEELPYYSSFILDEPMKMFLTVVPPTRDLDYSTGLNHYMAFLHGVEEEDLKLLRRFVNQMIFNKPEEFKYIENIPVKQVAVAAVEEQEYEEERRERKPPKQDVSVRVSIDRESRFSNKKSKL